MVVQFDLLQLSLVPRSQVELFQAAGLPPERKEVLTNIFSRGIALSIESRHLNSSHVQIFHWTKAQLLERLDNSHPSYPTCPRSSS